MRRLVNLAVLAAMLLSSLAYAAPPPAPYFDTSLTLKGLADGPKTKFVTTLRAAAHNAINVYADRVGLVIKEGSRIPVETFQCVTFAMAAGVARVQKYSPAAIAELEAGRKKWCKDDDDSDPTKGKAIVLMALGTYAGGHSMNRTLSGDLKDEIEDVEASDAWGPAQVAVVGAIVVYVLWDEFMGITAFALP
jgi:hypothetical protein